MKKECILLDKSALTGLNIDWFDKLPNKYYTAIPFNLTNEVLQMPRKLAEEHQNPEEVKNKYLSLRKKLLHKHENSVWIPPSEELNINNLMGNEIPFRKAPFGPKDSNFQCLKKLSEETINNQNVINHAKSTREKSDKNSGKSFKETKSSDSIIKSKPSSLEEILGHVDKYLTKIDLKEALLLMQIGKQDHSEILKRWEAEQPPSLKEFAPYSYYVLRLNMLLTEGIKWEMISTSKKAKTDIGCKYLSHLPFCSFFVTEDKEQKKIANLFLEKDQKILSINDAKQLK